MASFRAPAPLNTEPLANMGRLFGQAMAMRPLAQAQAAAREQQAAALAANAERDRQMDEANLAAKLQETALKQQEVDDAEQAQAQMLEQVLGGAGLDEHTRGNLVAAREAGADYLPMLQSRTTPEAAAAVQRALLFADQLRAGPQNAVKERVQAFNANDAYQQAPALLASGRQDLLNALTAAAAGKEYTPFAQSGGYVIDQGTGATRELGTARANINRDNAAAGASSANAAESRAGIPVKTAQAQLYTDKRVNPERYRPAGRGGAEGEEDELLDGLTDAQAFGLYKDEYKNQFDDGTGSEDPTVSGYVGGKMAARRQQRATNRNPGPTVRRNLEHPLAKVLQVPGSTAPLVQIKPAAGAPVRVQTAAEAARLPKGTRFLTPDGRVKVRP